MEIRILCADTAFAGSKNISLVRVCRRRYSEKGGYPVPALGRGV